MYVPFDHHARYPLFTHVTLDGTMNPYFKSIKENKLYQNFISLIFKTRKNYFKRIITSTEKIQKIFNTIYIYIYIYIVGATGPGIHSCVYVRLEAQSEDIK